MLIFCKILKNKYLIRIIPTVSFFRKKYLITILRSDISLPGSYLCFFLNHLDYVQPSSLKILLYLLNLLNQYLILRLSTLSKTNNQSIAQQASYILLRLFLADLKKIQKWYFILYEVITF